MTTPHGTYNRYTEGCRCEPCREANRKFHKKRRAERHRYTQTNGLPAGVKHGSSAYNNWGCRCTICTADWSANCLRRYHARKKKEKAK